MFRNTYQKGFLSIFSSTGSKPLAIWCVQAKNGHIKRVTDNDLNSLVLEMISSNVATTFICAPAPPCCSLAIKLPFIIMIVKNLKKYFTFEIQVLDDRQQLRRFRVSNYQSATRVNNFCTSMPLSLESGWNQIQFNLADFVQRAYGTSYVETIRIQVHANVRLRRIFFTDRLYHEDEKPIEYRLFKPIPEKKVIKIRKKTTEVSGVVEPEQHEPRSSLSRKITVSAVEEAEVVGKEVETDMDDKEQTDDQVEEMQPVIEIEKNEEPTETLKVEENYIEDEVN